MRASNQKSESVRANEVIQSEKWRSVWAHVNSQSERYENGYWVETMYSTFSSKKLFSLLIIPKRLWSHSSVSLYQVKVASLIQNSALNSPEVSAILIVSKCPHLKALLFSIKVLWITETRDSLSSSLPSSVCVWICVWRFISFFFNM